MKHLDLFSGIGGFSYAFDQIFNETKNTHIFCEIDPFCQAVIKKHWPDSILINDIKTFADTRSSKPRRLSRDERKALYAAGITDKPFLLTGGFPCQPFSQAGRRKGTEDDRHLWPHMLKVIRYWQPSWIIAENVRGLLTIGEGLVFEQVCTDLESAGYEVQPIIIPAVALNAPHRRDRVWFIAYRRQQHGSKRGNERVEKDKAKRSSRISDAERRSQENPTDATSKRLERRRRSEPSKSESAGLRGRTGWSWNENWLEIATRLCRVDDGLPRRMDRNPRLKALGNAIVPQVAMEIMKAIKATI